MSNKTIIITPYVDNTLYDANFFNNSLRYRALDSYLDEQQAKFNMIKVLFSRYRYDSMSEAELENKLIQPVLAVLNWKFTVQDSRSVHGQNQRPDYALFSCQDDEHDYQGGNYEAPHLYCEAKAWSINLDARDAKSHSPYYQLINYMNAGRIHQSILTNGRSWQLVDTTELTSHKKRVIFNLEAIINNDSYDDFALFYLLLNAKTYLKEGSKSSLHQTLEERDALARTDLKENLKDAIFGRGVRESVFEQVGLVLYQQYPDTSFELLHQNGIYFLFRVLFVAFFEDQNWDVMSKHKKYPDHSLRCIIDKADKKVDNKDYDINQDLYELFEILDKGKPRYDIPLLNGGLFDMTNPQATLLEKGDRFFDNGTIKSIFKTLFYHYDEERKQEVRSDFKGLNPRHIGEIYEGLLECRFRLADEELLYVEYDTKEGVTNGYFDGYDSTNIDSKKIKEKRTIAINQFYMDKGNLMRKQTGSYYTPPMLSGYLAKGGIDRLIDIKKVSPTDIKMIDPACGSGHLLLDALDYLTGRCLTDAALFDSLKPIVLDERIKIEGNLKGFNEHPIITDEQIIRRLIMKKSVYGVDINSFSVEITKLSLWLNTFIFGTPLSLIEHHIVCGNALMGTDLQSFEAFFSLGGTGYLLKDAIAERYEGLKEKFLLLNDVKDTTKAEIEQSKALMASIQPDLDALNGLLNQQNMLELQLARASLLKGPQRKAMLEAVNQLISRVRSDDHHFVDLSAELKPSGEKFVNFQVSFPEVFSREASGFDLVIANPPWEKTKFEEPLFFAQLHSRYRGMSNNDKATFKSNWLFKPWMKKRYDDEKQRVELANAYYKQYYPLSRGAGDGNLYRFFVERAWQLLNSTGNVSFVVPTGLLTDDGGEGLRRAMATMHPLIYSLNFENRGKAFFPDVDSRYKFGLTQMDKTGNPAVPVRTLFMQADPLTTARPTLPWLSYPFSLVQQLSPKNLAFLEVQCQQDLDLYGRAVQLYKGLQSDWLDFKNDLHATNDKDLFLEHPTEGAIPLYKGAAMHQYTSEFDPTAKQWIMADKLQERKGHSHYQQMRLAYRAIASDTNERTMICAMLPPNSTAQHSMWIAVPTAIEKQLFFMAVANSTVYDYFIRFTVAINVTKSNLQKIAIPQPTLAQLQNPATVYHQLAGKALLLCAYHNPTTFAPMLGQFGLSPAHIPPTAKQYDHLLVSIDHAVARLYHITRTELAHLASPTYFKVLNNKRPAYVKLLIDSYEDRVEI